MKKVLTKNPVRFIHVSDLANASKEYFFLQNNPLINPVRIAHANELLNVSTFTLNHLKNPVKLTDVS